MVFLSDKERTEIYLINNELRAQAERVNDLALRQKDDLLQLRRLCWGIEQSAHKLRRLGDQRGDERPDDFHRTPEV